MCALTMALMGACGGGDDDGGSSADAGASSPDGGPALDSGPSDTVAPQVMNTTPLADATDVDRATTISVVFDEPIAMATINDTSFVIEAAGVSVSGSVTPSANGATFTPDVPLIFDGATYTARLTTAITDVAGNPLAAEHAWSFDTAPRSWTSDADVYSVSDTDARDPQIATGGDGHAMAVWLNFNNLGGARRISASRYVPGAGWETAVELQNAGVHTALSPSVAMDGSGNAIAVWREFAAGRYSGWASYYTAGSGWSAAALIESNDASNMGDSSVAFDGAGNAIAIFQLDGSVWANRYVPGSGWGAAERIETAGGAASGFVELAVSANGEAIATWHKFNGTRNDVWANRYVSGSWGTATTVDATTDTAEIPHVAMDQSGNGIVVWQQRGATSATHIWARRLDASSGWEPGAAIETETDTGSQARIAMTPNGDAVVVWRQVSSGVTDIWFNRYTKGSGWGTAAALDTGSENAAEPQIATDIGGHVTALWKRSDGVRDNIWTARFSGTWSAAAEIETDDTSDASIPRVAVDGLGNSMAIWLQSDGTYDTLRWARRH